MNRVVVTRKLPIDIVKALSDFNVELNNTDEALSVTRLRHLLTDADGLICMLDEKIDRTLIESAPNLKVIANYAVGVNNIDLVAAKERNITICNTPKVLTKSTAELGFALMMAAARRLSEGDRLTRKNLFPAWQSILLAGTDLSNKTLGIYGMGAIGQAVANMAKGFDMKIIFNNRTKPKTATPNTTFCDFDTLLAESDFLMICAPLNPDTKYRFTISEFKKMKSSAIFINIGRGQIVREADLVTALKTNEIAAAGLDVYEDEPIVNKELKSLSNTILTPHIGSSTLETRIAMATMCTDSIISVLKKGVEPKNVVK